MNQVLDRLRQAERAATEAVREAYARRGKGVTDADALELADLRNSISEKVMRFEQLAEVSL